MVGEKREESEETGTKSTLSVRVTTDTRRRAEWWVAKHQNVLGRSDVLRAIFEMGLRAAAKNGGIELSPPPEPERPGRRRVRAANGEDR